ncbi:MAG: hypothetical protein J7641_11070 [Cyanobacteria bacterium SID2]|nr:hypothetical protein [Cyanobacteria bacterium SID2]MBP0002298.1 hypothetical protein [Cyanobacteria bacterium SBC]
MCFSATASFTVSALLLPIGIYTTRLALAQNTKYLPLACIPVIFSVQQALEGLAWLGLNVDRSTAIEIGATGFLLFAYWFWPFWAPLSLWSLEDRPWAKRVFLGFTIVGGLFGAMLYLSLFSHANWLSVEVVNHSIAYHVTSLYDGFLPRDVTRFIYLQIVILPFLLSVVRELKIFGGLIVLSVIFTYEVFNYAFVSVWCFFAAVLSLYLVYIMPRLLEIESDSSKPTLYSSIDD